MDIDSPRVEEAASGGDGPPRSRPPSRSCCAPPCAMICRPRSTRCPRHFARRCGCAMWKSSRMRRLPAWSAYRLERSCRGFHEAAACCRTAQPVAGPGRRRGASYTMMNDDCRRTAERLSSTSTTSSRRASRLTSSGICTRVSAVPHGRDARERSPGDRSRTSAPSDGYSAPARSSHPLRGAGTRTRPGIRAIRLLVEALRPAHGRDDARHWIPAVLSRHTPVRHRPGGAAHRRPREMLPLLREEQSSDADARRVEQMLETDYGWDLHVPPSSSADGSV